MHNKAYRDAKSKTRFGKLVSGTEYEDYAINNSFISDNSDFIDKKSGTSNFLSLLFTKMKLLVFGLIIHTVKFLFLLIMLKILL